MRKSTNMPYRYIDIYEAASKYMEENGVSVADADLRMGRKKGRVSSLIARREYARMDTYRRLAAALDCDLNIIMYDPEAKMDFRGLRQFLAHLSTTSLDQTRLQAALSMVPDLAWDPETWRETDNTRISSRRIYEMAKTIGCIPVFELISQKDGRVYSADRDKVVEISKRTDARDAGLACDGDSI